MRGGDDVQQRAQLGRGRHGARSRPPCGSCRRALRHGLRGRCSSAVARWRAAASSDARTTMRSCSFRCHTSPLARLAASTICSAVATWPCGCGGAASIGTSPRRRLPASMIACAVASGWSLRFLRDHRGGSLTQMRERADCDWKDHLQAPTFGRPMPSQSVVRRWAFAANRWLQSVDRFV